MSEQCDECSAAGKAVPLSLVRYHLSKPWQRELEDRQFSFCETPDCSVVYFSVEGNIFTVEDVRQGPAYKTGDGGDLLCFCFDVTGSNVTGPNDPSAYIREQVRRGECACNVSNPSGECCLGSIARWQRTTLPVA